MDKIINKVLVYIDGTEQSITAVQYAICLCKKIDAELNAIYVVNTKALNDLLKANIFLKTEQEEYKQDLESDAIKYLEHVKELGEQKGIILNTIHTSGSVNQEIRNAINDLEIDLLIVGELSRIRSRRDELLNEAERAMRTSPCSVIVVKDEDRVWDIFENLA